MNTINTMKIKLAPSLLTALALCGASMALADDTHQHQAPTVGVDLDADFEWMLRSVDQVPNATGLVAHFENIEERLIAAATDMDRDEYTRHRALSLLSLYPTQETAAVIRTIIATPAHPDRALAVYTLGRGWSQQGGETLALEMEMLASDPDDEVSENAVRALRWIEDPAAVEALGRLASNPNTADLATYVLSRRQAQGGSGSVAR